jgi:Uma2 family endonuclease
VVEDGVMEEDERVKLIGGELVPMSPKGSHHEVVKIALLRRWCRVAPDDVDLAPETTFRLSEDTYLEPDVVVYPRATGLGGLTGANALLVVEIADSSLRYDMGRKAALYASFGMGHRRGPPHDPGLPGSGRGWLSRGARFYLSRARRASVRG